MWAGCEPVCAIVSKLLKNGYFYSHPWNNGLAYLFRKNVPRLIFVFANECDNQFNMWYDYTNGFQWQTVSLVPGTNNNITFAVNNKNRRDVNAEDPFCVGQLGTSNILGQINDYLSTVEVDESSPANQSVNWLWDQGNLGQIAEIVTDKNQYKNADIKWKEGRSVKSSTEVKMAGFNERYDLDRKKEPFSGMLATELLTNA